MLAPELKDGEVDVRIRTPLPGRVLLTLGNLIEASWPGAQLVDGEAGEVTFRINKGARTAVADEAAAALRVEPEEEDLDIHSLGSSGVSMANPIGLAVTLMENMRDSFAENPDAANYLETTVRDPESGARYVLIFAKSQAQTPHEFRTKAEKNLATARQDAHAANTAAVQRLLRAPSAGANTYEVGVKAALDAMRQLNYGNVSD
jgi:hypothetical protein